jgi:hypothetical protein
MKVIFTSATDAEITWDGVLWSEGRASLATALNHAVLPMPDSHGGILGQATRLLESFGFRTTATRVEDDTGWPEEQIGEDCFFVEEDLAGSSEESHSHAHDRNDQTGFEGSALAAAEAHLSDGVCADEEPDEDDWDRPEREWQALIAWCRQNELILDGPGPLYDGGREHDVRFEPESGRWWKWTKPGLTGFTVDWNDAGEPWLRNAGLLEYFSRLRRQNTLLQDDFRLEGVWWHTSGWRVVTSQPDVPGGRASEEEIQSGMAGLGAVPLRWSSIGYEHSTGWRIGRMCVWDVHPGNVVLTESGLLVPVDVIITPLPDGWPPCHFHDHIPRSTRAR